MRVPRPCRSSLLPSWRWLAPLSLAASGITSCVLDPDRARALPDDLLVLPPGADGPDAAPTDAAEPSDGCLLQALTQCHGGLVQDLWQANGTARLCQRFGTLDLASAGVSSPSGTHGLSLVDLNQDGSLDLFLLRGSGAHQLFLNAGDGAFTESGAQYGLAFASDAHEAQWRDYDQDGDLDLFLVGASGSQLLTQIDGRFSPIEGGGIDDPNPGTTAAWIGNDLLLATENGTRFYRYDGAGHFTEAAAEVGLADDGAGAAIVVADYDLDGALDLFLANRTGPNRLFRNLGDGTYAAVEATVGLPTDSPVPSTDAAWVHLPPFTRPALYVANWEGANQLFLPQPDGTFVDQALAFGVRDPGTTVRSVWGTPFGAQAPVLFLGRWGQPPRLYGPQCVTGPGDLAIDGFADISVIADLPVDAEVLAAAWGDLNHDGRDDLAIVTVADGLLVYLNQSAWVETCAKGVDP